MIKSACAASEMWTFLKRPFWLPLNYERRLILSEVEGPGGISCGFKDLRAILFIDGMSGDTSVEQKSGVVSTANEFRN